MTLLMFSPIYIYIYTAQPTDRKSWERSDKNQHISSLFAGYSGAGYPNDQRSTKLQHRQEEEELKGDEEKTKKKRFLIDSEHKNIQMYIAFEIEIFNFISLLRAFSIYLKWNICIIVNSKNIHTAVNGEREMR